MARGERREALSISGAQRSPGAAKRKGRGSEHGAGLGSAARGAAQAGLTEGAERSSRLRHETNVKWGKISRRLHRESAHFSALEDGGGCRFVEIVEAVCAP